MDDSSQKGMLLVVEQDARFTEKFKKYLRLDNMRPFFVESGKDALFMLESMKATFLLINLNGIHSWEELNGLINYAKEKRVPYLFVEGLRKTRGVAARLREKGYTSFIKLPFSVKTLIAEIKRHATSDTLLGRQLGPLGQRVELHHQLGKGATGVVYQASQESLERQVAVKFLAEEHQQDEEATARFFREAKAIAQMRSPHIVQVYFVGSHENRPYLVMEYINGPTLEKYIRSKGCVKPARALRIVREILLGLAEAHHHQKIHRDLKPANIMLNRQGQAVILDFGLVRETGATELTQAGMVMGTPRYISPEQVRGQDLDTRCDLYSLGIILFELLLGDVPFKGKDFVSVLWKHVKSPLPKPQDFGKHVDPALFAVVEKLAHKEPDARYQSAEEALRDVEPLLESYSQGSLTNQTGTRELLDQVHPIGGMAVNEAGDLTHQFGNMPYNRAKALHVISGLVSQIQGIDSLGSFHRGLISLDDHKLMVFNCFDGLAGIETSASEVTTKFNMMDTAELASLFQGEFDQ